MFKNNFKFSNFYFILIASTFLFIFTGCKNFLSGADLIQELETQIDYATQPYANITINSSSDFTKQIIPSSGVYDSKYKKTDVIQLSLSVKDNYQFIYWKAEPEKSINFENIYSQKTAGTIINTDEPITISPVCIIRPTVTFEPENRSDGVPKNTSIIISFSEPMDLSENDLKKIKINSGIENLNDNFHNRSLSDDKKQITLIADRYNLINLGSGTKVITVTVPKDFYYNFEGNQVTLEDDVTYSYRINSQTNDKTTINIKSSEIEGKISYSGRKTYYLDDEINLTFTPNDDYIFEGWSIVDNFGKEISPSILETKFSDNLKTVNIKVLSGFDKEINITPVCIVKGKLIVNFNTEYGSITPSEKNEYYLNDTFRISYTEGTSGYKFLGWKIIDTATQKPVTDVIQIENLDNETVTVKVIQENRNITIKPECVIRPTVTFEPENRSDGVAKNTSIIITFSQPMDISEDDLTRIQLLSGLEDISGNFQIPPEMNEEKTQIIYYANNTNLMNFTSGTKLITVNIPQDFHYLYNDKKIFLKDSVSYSYRVNTTTLDKVTINVSTVTGGEISYIGKDTYYLDDELTVKYTPLPTYEFSGWKITDSDNQDISESIVKVLTSLESQTLTVKICGGYEDDEINITPICKEKKTITVKFETEYGSITPAEEKQYYKDDNFEVSYSEGASGYAFKYWKVYDSETYEDVTDSLEFIHEDSYTTSVKVKKDNRNVTIKPILDERPQVKLTLPTNGKENLVRNSSIKILFTQEMNPKYLTSDYIKVTQGVLRSTNEEIVIDATDATEILTYSLNTKKDLLTITLNENKYFTMNAYISVEISKEVLNANGTPFADDYEFQFQVSNDVDALAPVINLMSVGLGCNSSNDYKNKYRGIDNIEYKKGDQTLDRTINNTFNEIQGAYDKFFEKTTETPYKDVKLYDNIISTEKLNFYIQAGDIVGYKETASSAQIESDVTSIGYRITCAISSISSSQNFLYENTFSYNGNGGELLGTKKDYSGDSTNNDDEKIKSGTTFSIDLNDLGGSGKKAPDGILRIDVFAIDKNGNNGLDEQYWYKHGNGYRTLFVAKGTNPPEINTAKWHKTNTEKKIAAGIKNGVKEDSYIKFYIEEGLAGIKSFEFDIKDSKGASVNLTNNVIIKYSKNDEYNSAQSLDATLSNNTFTYNNVNTEYKTDNLLSGWYYITGLINDNFRETDYTIKIKITDGLNKETVIESPVYVDRSKVTLTGGETNPLNAPGPIVASYSFKDGNINENIYPRVGKPGITGEAFWNSPNIINGDGNKVRWFYTNAWNNSNEWGIYLKQTFKKNNISSTTPAILVYQKNSNKTLSDEELAAITKESVLENPTETIKIESGTSFERYIEVGTHSFVLMNDSGDINPAVTFVVVKDDKGPEMVTSDNRSLKYLVTLDCPNLYHINNDGWETWYRHTGPTETEPYMDWYPYDDCYYVNNTKITNMYARNIRIVCKESEINNNNLIVRLSGSGRNAEHRTIYNNNKFVYTNHPNDGEYWEDSKPSRTSSGIAQYYICRVFYTWRNEENKKANFLSVFPPETNVKDRFMKDIYHQGKSMFYYTEGVPENKRVYDKNYTDNPLYFDKWQEYTPGSDITIPIFKDYGFEPVKISNDTYKYWMPPINLCFKDNCGNIDYMLCTHPGWEDYSSFAFRIDVTDYK